MKVRILFYTVIEGELGSPGNALRSVHRESGPLVEANG